MKKETLLIIVVTLVAGFVFGLLVGQKGSIEEFAGRSSIEVGEWR